MGVVRTNKTKEPMRHNERGGVDARKQRAKGERVGGFT